MRPARLSFSQAWAVLLGMWVLFVPIVVLGSGILFGVIASPIFRPVGVGFYRRHDPLLEAEFWAMFLTLVGELPLLGIHLWLLSSRLTVPSFYRLATLMLSSQILLAFLAAGVALDLVFLQVIPQAGGLGNYILGCEA